MSRDYDRKNNLSNERDGLIGGAVRDKTLSVRSNRRPQEVILFPPTRKFIRKKIRQDWHRDEAQVLWGW